MDPLTMGLLLGGSALGSGIGGFFQSSAAKDAANAQAQAAANALAFQQKVYGDTQQNFKPYLGAGKGAINQLAGLYGIGPGGTGQQNYSAFTQSPDYNFALQQGNLALQRQGAAAGNLLSGGQLKAGQQFGQGLASQQFGNYFNRLLSLATMGQNSAANAATSAGTMANNIASTQLAQGNYQAGGMIGQANALSSIFPNTLAGYSTLSNIFKNSGSSPSTSAYANNTSGGTAMWSPSMGA